MHVMGGLEACFPRKLPLEVDSVLHALEMVPKK